MIITMYSFLSNFTVFIYMLLKIKNKIKIIKIYNKILLNKI